MRSVRTRCEHTFVTRRGSNAMDRDALQLLLAQGVSVEQIGRRFGRHPSTVSYWMRKHGLEAPNRAKHASKGGIERERLTELVGRGMTIAEIAEEVGLSKGAVRHWLGRYNLHTSHRRGRRSGPASRDAKQAGPPHDHHDLRAPRRVGISARGPRRLPMQTMPVRGGVAAPRGRSRRRSSPKPADDAVCADTTDTSELCIFITSTRGRSGSNVQRERDRISDRDIARGGPQVRAVVLQLPRRGRSRRGGTAATFSRANTGRADRTSLDRYTMIRGNSIGRVFGC